MSYRWSICALSIYLILSALTASATNAENALRANLAKGLARGMPSIPLPLPLVGA
jgi:hypothetical protein